MNDRRVGRSLFWPIVLVGVGLIWLLANLGVLPANSLGSLFRLWPVLLIAIGLEILIGRRAPWASALVGLAMVALLVGGLYAAPGLGWNLGQELKTVRVSEPLGEATAGRVTLDLSRWPVALRALASDSEDLLAADLTVTGEVEFNASGSTEKTLTLGHTGEVANPFFWLEGDTRQRWEIGLTPAIPLDLTVDVGSGSADLDLSRLQLRSFDLEGGSGSVDLAFSTGPQRYPAQINSGSSSVDIRLAEGIDLDLSIDSGSGSVNIQVPAGASLQVDVRDTGSGSIRLPAGLVQVRDGDDGEGTWETAGFESSAPHVLITIADQGSGSINIR